MENTNLKIRFYNEQEVIIENKRTSLELYKFDDGALEVILGDNNNVERMILSKEQIDFLINWYTNK